ncbi:hypothetical protein [Luteimonas colneyensis]|nr:hypothetical protein [Luteimonas colneyensis]
MPMTHEPVRPGILKPATTAVAAMIAALLMAIIIFRALALPPIFDGSMNLQVAWNLAEGSGYHRSYAEQPVFPREVQTNGPFILTAALAYRAFGMGVMQSQLANIAFLLLLAGAACWIGRSMRGRLCDGLLAVILTLSTPGLVKFGFGGYGEIPSLALGLAGLAAYPWAGTGPAIGLRTLLGAALLGAAVTTKTVMLVCVIPFSLVMFVHAVSRPLPLASRGLRAVLLVAGFLAPVVAWEAYRMLALGGLDSYRAWWALETASISREAGVKGGVAASLAAKVAAHFGKLANFLQVSAPFASAWLVLPFAAAVLVPRQAGAARWILLALLGAAAAYFAWWLGLTPTPKAWHRRIFNGMILLNIAWVLVAGALMAGPVVAAWRRQLGLAMMLAAAAFAAAFLGQTRVHGALGPLEVDHVHRAVSMLRALPRDAHVYAAGWSSAPQISLLAGRPLLDINDIPHDALAAASPAFLVVDQEGGHSVASRRILTMYPSIAMIEGNTLPQIYRFDARVLAGTPEVADLSQRVALGTLDDAQALGFHKAEGDGRWASGDIAVRTPYRGEDTLALEAYVLPPASYDRDRPPSLSIHVDDCQLPGLPTTSGLRVIDIPLDACAPEPGREVTIRISSDTLVESSFTKDDRAMAFIAKSLELKDLHP